MLIALLTVMPIGLTGAAPVFTHPELLLAAIGVGAVFLGDSVRVRPTRPGTTASRQLCPLALAPTGVRRGAWRHSPATDTASLRGRWNHPGHSRPGGPPGELSRTSQSPRLPSHSREHSRDLSFSASTQRIRVGQGRGLAQCPAAPVVLSIADHAPRCNSATSTLCVAASALHALRAAGQPAPIDGNHRSDHVKGHRRPARRPALRLLSYPASQAASCRRGARSVTVPVNVVSPGVERSVMSP